MSYPDDLPQWSLGRWPWRVFVALLVATAGTGALLTAHHVTPRGLAPAELFALLPPLHLGLVVSLLVGLPLWQAARAAAEPASRVARLLAMVLVAWQGLLVVIWRWPGPGASFARYFYLALLGGMVLGAVLVALVVVDRWRRSRAPAALPTVLLTGALLGVAHIGWRLFGPTPSPIDPLLALAMAAGLAAASDATVASRPAVRRVALVLVGVATLHAPLPSLAPVLVSVQLLAGLVAAVNVGRGLPRPAHAPLAEWTTRLVALVFAEALVLASFLTVAPAELRGTFVLAGSRHLQGGAIGLAILATWLARRVARDRLAALGLALTAVGVHLGVGAMILVGVRGMPGGGFVAYVAELQPLFVVSALGAALGGVGLALLVLRTRPAPRAPDVHEVFA